MKKQLTILLCSLLLVASAHTQTTGEKKGWPSVERYSFISSCIKSAEAFMSTDSARFYCYCMLEYTEAKYPDINDAAKITNADMQKPDWQKQINLCRGGTWKDSERQEFLTNCISSAKTGGMDGDKAKNYCECMLFKIEKMYPDAVEATKELTDEALKSPKWKAILESCLKF